jgi:hypothetical protein
VTGYDQMHLLSPRTRGGRSKATGQAAQLAASSLHARSRSSPAHLDALLPAELAAG